MANHRFKLSNMMPNAWFYKLRDMGGQSQRRKSDLASQIRAMKAPMVHNECRSLFPSRVSTNGRKTIYKPSLGPKENVQDSLYYTVSPCSESVPSSDPFDEARSWSSSCSPRFSSSTADIIIDIDQKIERFDNQVGLPPILTKPTTKHKKHDDLHEEIKDALHKHHRSLSIEISNHETDNRRRRQRQRVPKDSISQPLGQELTRKSSGVKMREKSRCRVVAMSFSRETRRTTRRSVSLESFAVVKCSYDPEKDFRDSMVEMIVEQHIEGSKDLEDLLACYLTLNSNEYHDVIVNAFGQIWCELF